MRRSLILFLILFNWLKAFLSSDNVMDLDLFRINNIDTPSDLMINHIENLYGKPSEGYYISVYLGTPPQKLNILIDTGSSNFAVASKDFDIVTNYFEPKNSSSFIDLKKNVEVPYTQGDWKGSLGSDIFAISNGYIKENASLTALETLRTRVNVALIHNFTNFFINGSDWHGILGLGYSRLSRPDPRVLPPFEQMVLDGLIKNVFSIQLCSYDSLYFSAFNHSKASGTLIFGGIVESLYFGKIFYTPIIKKWYYEIAITKISVGDADLGFPCSAYNVDRAIVDTGTTNFRVGGVIFDEIIEKMKKSTQINIPNPFWYGQQIMCWEHGNAPFSFFPNIEISLASTSSEYDEFKLVITPQLYLRNSFEDDYEKNSQSCFKFSISRSERGIVIGAVLMEGFYIVFDRENSKIGFAESSCAAYGNLNTNARIFNSPKRNTSVRLCYNQDEFKDIYNIIRILMFLLASMTMVSLILPLFIVVRMYIITNPN